MLKQILCCACLLTLLLAARTALAQVPSAPGDWPQWRGPHRDGISTEQDLLKKWPEAGPKVAWQIENVGVGYSSLAIKDGRIITQGDLDGVEHIIAVNAADGKLLWAVQPEPVAAKLAERVAQEMQRADANGDGRIDEVEALARFGMNFTNSDRAAELGKEQARALAEKRAATLLAALDTDGDGALTDSEAAAFGREFSRIDGEDPQVDKTKLAASRAGGYIKQLDKDGDGRISRDEARRTSLDSSFNRADERDPATNRGDQQLTAAEIQAYLERFEPGRDGAITQQELADYYANRHAGADGILTIEELRTYFGGYRNGQGDGPRGTPTIDGEKIYVEGGNGDLTCLDLASGRTIWHRSLIEDFGGGRPGWGYCESPLVVGDQLIVTPGGKQGTVAALDKRTGNVAWRSEGVSQSAHYSSAVVAEIGGIKQIVQFARNSMFGVALDGGRLLWEYDGANNGTANVCTPIVHADHVFASSSYGTGGGLAKITTAGESQSAEEVYFENRMANHHGGIVKVGDYMYGFGSGGLICMNYLTGEIAWRDRSVGKGSLVVADGMLYLLGERYEVALAEATPEEYREHGRFTIESFGRPSWAHPVVADGRFYIRNQHTLTAYDVSEK